jgi:hypothetical protein
MQLMTIDPGKDKHHLFKNHFCWVKPGDLKNHYEFCKRTGGQAVAYSAIKEGADEVQFYRGKIEPGKEPDPENEVKFLDISKVDGLSSLSEGGLSLDGIYSHKDGVPIIELTAFQHHGEPIRLRQKDGKWVLVSNPNMQLISRNEFTDLLKGENNGLGNMSSGSTENPLGYSGAGNYLVFQEKTGNVTSRNFMFLIPEEVRDDAAVESLLKPGSDGKKEGKVDAASPYGLLGCREPRKLDYSEDTLSVQSHFLRWSRDKVGRYGEFSIPESEGKDIARTALSLMARAMREKNYAQGLGFLNALPGGLQLGKGEGDDAIRKMFFNIIWDDFDRTPEAAAMHMQLLLKWFQMDSGHKTVQEFFSKFNKGKNAQSLVELVKEKYIRACREEAFYSPHLALNPLQKQALLEKLMAKIIVEMKMIMHGKRNIARSSEILSLDRTREKEHPL